MSENIIEIRELNKSYTTYKNESTVLSNLSLDIKRGDFLTIMGPSGSGKTTLLNLISGLDKPTSGSIIVNGQSIHNLSQSQLADWRAQNIGFVFQFFNLLPIFSVRRNVEIPLLLTNLSSSEREKRASIALEVVGLKTFEKRKPKQLSGGQEQRVAIARALVSDPSILVCDEPTGNLDRNTADEIMKLLQLLNREYGKTIVMVTHDPKAASYAKKCIYCDKGSISIEEVA